MKDLTMCETGTHCSCLKEIPDDYIEVTDLQLILMTNDYNFQKGMHFISHLYTQNALYNKR